MRHIRKLTWASVLLAFLLAAGNGIGADWGVTGKIIKKVRKDTGFVLIFEQLTIERASEFRSQLRVRKNGKTGSVSTKQERTINQVSAGRTSGNVVGVSLGEGDLLEIELSVFERENLIFIQQENYQFQGGKLLGVKSRINN